MLEWDCFGVRPYRSTSAIKVATIASMRARTTLTGASTARGKLASHRLRGRGWPENSLAALKDMCALDVPYIEIDTRATRDGRLFVHHDPVFATRHWRSLRFANVDAATLIQRQRPSRPVAELETALAVFKETARPQSILCIDVKDFGYEQQHLELAHRYELDHRILFISWMPQSLCAFADHGFGGPLILSQFNLSTLGLLGRATGVAMRPFRIKMGHRLLVGENRAADELGNHATDYDERLISAGLPQWLLRVLKESRGGLCVPKLLYGKGLTRFTSEAGLQLWLYTATTVEQFFDVASWPGVDVVLCDDAAGVIQMLGDSGERS
jgi:glycerophosphoryl diester phosphodiesterase